MLWALSIASRGPYGFGRRRGGAWMHKTRTPSVGELKLRTPRANAKRVDGSREWNRRPPLSKGGQPPMRLWSAQWLVTLCSRLEHLLRVLHELGRDLARDEALEGDRDRGREESPSEARAE